MKEQEWGRRGLGRSRERGIGKSERKKRARGKIAREKGSGSNVNLITDGQSKQGRSKASRAGWFRAGQGKEDHMQTQTKAP